MFESIYNSKVSQYCIQFCILEEDLYHISVCVSVFRLLFCWKEIHSLLPTTKCVLICKFVTSVRKLIIAGLFYFSAEVDLGHGTPSTLRQRNTPVSTLGPNLTSNLSSGNLVQYEDQLSFS